MARYLKLPNTGSTITSTGSIYSSSLAAVWLGFATPISSSGSVMWFRGGSNTTGCEILPIVASPAQTIIYGPFIFTSGVTVGSVVGGSAIIYMG